MLDGSNLERSLHPPEGTGGRGEPVMSRPPWQQVLPSWLRSGGARGLALTVGVGVLLFVVLSLAVPRFCTAYNLFNIVIQASIYGTMAVGLTLVLITGGIDISLPSIMAASTVVGVSWMVATGNWAYGCLISLGITLVAGLVNAVSVTTFRMPSLIVTLATQTVGSGFTVWYTNYLTITGIPRPLMNFFRMLVVGVPMYVIVFAVIVVAGQYMLTRTRHGRWLYLVGVNAQAAQVTGIPVRTVTGATYVLSAVSAGVAGVMLATQIGSAQPGMGNPSMVLDIVSSAVIGGVSIYGGKGTVLGAAVGAILIATISNVMNLLGIQFYMTLMLKGLIIILATALDNARR